MAPVFWLSLRQLTSGARLVLVFLLALLPVALALIVFFTVADDENFEETFINVLLDGLLVAAILPIITMALSTAAFGNELEDRTLSFLVLNPIPRWKIILPKLLASVAISGPLLIVSGTVAALLGFEWSVKAAVAVGVAVLVGVGVYGSIFTWAGLITSRALAFGLIYVLLWEGIISTFIEGVDYLSVRGYILAIMYGLNESEFTELGSRVIEFQAAIVGAAAVTAVFVLLSIRRLRRMDVP